MWKSLIIIIGHSTYWIKIESTFVVKIKVAPRVVCNTLCRIMVCFHCPTPIPILIPIPMELASIVMCRTVSAEPTPIPMHAPIPMPMGTVPILAPTLVLIRCNLTSFHCNFCIGIGPSGALLHTIRIRTIIGIGIGVGQWKHTISPSIILTLISFHSRILLKLTIKSQRMTGCNKQESLFVEGASSA